MVMHVIDDDEAVRESLEALLVVSGFDVKTYGSRGRLSRAVRRFRRLHLLDIHMPGMGGLDLLQELVGSRTAGIPVLVLTASRETAPEERALELGASAFLTKPVREATLVEALRAARLEGTDNPLPGPSRIRGIHDCHVSGFSLSWSLSRLNAPFGADAGKRNVRHRQRPTSTAAIAIQPTVSLLHRRRSP